MSLLDTVVVPVADPDDAAETVEALDRLEPGRVVVVYVVEKAGGAPDKAGVEQREDEGQRLFEVFRERHPDAETEIRYGTDVTDAVFAAADDHGATAVAFHPREGGRLVRLLSGDHALKLVTQNDVPVISLPDP